MNSSLCEFPPYNLKEKILKLCMGLTVMAIDIRVTPPLEVLNLIISPFASLVSFKINLCASTQSLFSCPHKYDSSHPKVLKDNFVPNATLQSSNTKLCIFEYSLPLDSKSKLEIFVYQIQNLNIFWNPIIVRLKPNVSFF